MPRKKLSESPLWRAEEDRPTRGATRATWSVRIYPRVWVIFLSAKKLEGGIENCWRCVFSNLAENPRLGGFIGNS